MSHRLIIYEKDEMLSCFAYASFIIYAEGNKNYVVGKYDPRTGIEHKIFPDKKTVDKAVFEIEGTTFQNG